MNRPATLVLPERLMLAPSRNRLGAIHIDGADYFRRRLPNRPFFSSSGPAVK